MARRSKNKKKLAKAEWIKKIYDSIVNWLYSNIKLKIF